MVLLFMYNNMYASESPFDVLEWAGLFCWIYTCWAVCEQLVGKFWGFTQFQFPLEGKISAAKYPSLSGMGDCLVLFASYLDFLRISFLQLLNLINISVPSQCFKSNKYNAEKSLSPF